MSAAGRAETISFSMRAAGPQDAAVIEAIVVERWGAREIVSRGALHDAVAATAVLAECEGAVVGLATWLLAGDEAELLTLDALHEEMGIGGALVDAVADAAARAGARRLVLSTSNDNVHALGFYQRRGFRIAAVLPGALDEAREQKPAIPLIGLDGIEIHDELVLTRELGGTSAGGGSPAHLARAIR